MPPKNQHSVRPPKSAGANSPADGGPTAPQTAAAGLNLASSAGNESDQFMLEILPYPLPAAIQAEQVALLRTEWIRTDYDWLEAMNGDYSATLTIITVVGRNQERLLATATIHFARQTPEIAVLGNVLTHHAHRGLGLAGRVIDTALAQAERAGCSICLLGTAKKPRNVYLQHGFNWQSGAVMRRSFGAVDFETRYFAAGQPATVRPAHWGDLPGLTLLVSQPLSAASIDYPRGLLSGRYSTMERCLSNFPALWYATVPQGGALVVMAEPQIGRIFGFGSITLCPGTGQRHKATVDFISHDHYINELPDLLARLISGCRERKIQQVQAYIASGDEAKMQCLLRAGFTEVMRLPSALRLDSATRDIHLLNRAL